MADEQEAGQGRPYKGYAEYRRKADEARGWDNPFIALHDAARMLSGYGEDRAAQLVLQAHAAGGQGDYEKMSELLWQKSFLDKRPAIQWI